MLIESLHGTAAASKHRQITNDDDSAVGCQQLIKDAKYQKFLQLQSSLTQVSRKAALLLLLKVITIHESFCLRTPAYSAYSSEQYSWYWRTSSAESRRLFRRIVCCACCNMHAQAAVSQLTQHEYRSQISV